MRKIIGYVVASLLWAGSAIGAAYYQTIPNIATMQALGANSPLVGHVSVQNFTSGNWGGGKFDWDVPAAAPGGACTADNGIVFLATGVGAGTGCWVRQIPGTGQFSSTWWGAVPNSLANDYTANIKACITAVEAAHSSTGQAYTCLVEPGQYQQTSQISLLGNGAHFICNSSWTLGCTFFQMSNYTGLTTAGAMVIGDNLTSLFGSTIEGMDIEFTSPGIGVTGSIGMTSYGCNDMCGFARNFINGPNASCYVVRDSGPSSTNTYIFKNNTCFGAQAGTVTGPLIQFLNGTYPGEVNNIDVFCYPSHCPTNMIQYTNLPAVGSQITMEGAATNGIQVDASVPFTNITNVVHQFHSATGNVVNLTASSSSTSSVYLAGIERCCGGTNGTNSIVDGGNGLGFSATIADIQPMPYSRGATQYINSAQTKHNGLVAGGGTPTITGTCTHSAQVGGMTTGQFAATCTAQTIILTFTATAPNGWVCTLYDLTNTADKFVQTANTGTSCTSSSTTGAGDTIIFTAFGY